MAVPSSLSSQGSAAPGILHMGRGAAAVCCEGRLAACAAAAGSDPGGLSCNFFGCYPFSHPCFPRARLLQQVRPPLQSTGVLQCAFSRRLPSMQSMTSSVDTTTASGLGWCTWPTTTSPQVCARVHGGWEAKRRFLGCGGVHLDTSISGARLGATPSMCVRLQPQLGPHVWPTWCREETVDLGRPSFWVSTKDILHQTFPPWQAASRGGRLPPRTFAPANHLGAHAVLNAVLGEGHCAVAAALWWAVITTFPSHPS